MTSPIMRLPSARITAACSARAISLSSSGAPDQAFDDRRIRTGLDFHRAIKRCNSVVDRHAILVDMLGEVRGTRPQPRELVLGGVNRGAFRRNFGERIVEPDDAITDGVCKL